MAAPLPPPLMAPTIAPTAAPIALRSTVFAVWLSSSMVPSLSTRSVSPSAVRMLSMVPANGRVRPSRIRMLSKFQRHLGAAADASRWVHAGDRALDDRTFVLRWAVRGDCEALLGMRGSRAEVMVERTLQPRAGRDADVDVLPAALGRSAAAGVDAPIGVFRRAAIEALHGHRLAQRGVVDAACHAQLAAVVDRLERDVEVAVPGAGRGDDQLVAVDRGAAGAGPPAVGALGADGAVGFEGDRRRCRSTRPSSRCSRGDRSPWRRVPSGGSAGGRGRSAADWTAGRGWPGPPRGAGRRRVRCRVDRCRSVDDSCRAGDRGGGTSDWPSSR